MEVIKELLQHDASRETLTAKDCHGFNAFELAVVFAQSFEVMKLLLKEMPIASLDDIDWDTAMEYSYSRHPKFTRLFLQKKLRKRLDQLGLMMWKQNILLLIDGVVEYCNCGAAAESEYELVLRVLQEKTIDEELANYEMMEVTSLVELALWKMKCLSGFETNSGNAGEIIGASSEHTSPIQR